MIEFNSRMNAYWSEKASRESEFRSATEATESGKRSIDIVMAPMQTQTVVEIEPNLAIEKPIIKHKVPLVLYCTQTPVWN